MKAIDLKDVRILRGLPPARLGELLSYGTVVECPSGQTIVAQDSPADALYLVLEGEVHVYLEKADGGEMFLKTVGSGGHFGEIGVLVTGHRTATVRAQSACRLFRIDADSFQKLLEVPVLAVPILMGLSRSLALRLALVTSRLGELWSIKGEWATDEAPAPPPPSAHRGRL